MQLEPRAAAHSPSALGLCLRVSCWHRCSAVGDGCCRVTVSGGHVWPAEKPLAGLFTKQKLHFSSSNSSAARGVRRHLAKKIWRNSVVPGTWRYLSLSVGQDNLVLLPCALARAWCRQRWWHVKTLFRPRLTTSWPPPLYCIVGIVWKIMNIWQLSVWISHPPSRHSLSPEFWHIVGAPLLMNITGSCCTRHSWGRWEHYENLWTILNRFIFEN